MLSTFKLKFVTSSSIPIVKLFFFSSFKLSYTAFIIDGVVFFDDKPYLPPIIFILVSFKAFTTSRYNGSPTLPGSFVLSSTAICFTVFGNTSFKWFILNGLYRCTFTKPTL